MKFLFGGTLFFDGMKLESGLVPAVNFRASVHRSLRTVVELRFISAGMLGHSE